MSMPYNIDKKKIDSTRMLTLSKTLNASLISSSALFSENFFDMRHRKLGNMISPEALGSTSFTMS